MAKAKQRRPPPRARSPPGPVGEVRGGPPSTWCDGSCCQLPERRGKKLRWKREERRIVEMIVWLWEAGGGEEEERGQLAFFLRPLVSLD